MLRKFYVSNFKSFDSQLTLNLSSGRYAFHEEYIKNKIDNIAMIYGYNACGKSNLMLAIFDIVATLTDKNKDVAFYLSYQNAKNQGKPVNFSYEFVFGEDVIVYSYSKMDYFSIIAERLKINGKTVIEREAGKSQISVSLAGAETLDKNISSNKIAAVKYVSSNANLVDVKECNIFKKFISFVNRMLLFWCLQERRYIGYENGGTTLLQAINEAGLLDDFNIFLEKLGINRKLVKRQSPAGYDFYYDFGNGNLLPYNDFTPSNGEKALLLFFYWYTKRDSNEKPSIIAIDEFDAFYHVKLAKSIIKLLGESGCQVLLTSHNPALISNEILRPDCYYILEDGQISNFTNRSEKDIRQAQNLERMFRAGEFSNNE